MVLQTCLSLHIGNFPVGEEVDYPNVADDRTAKDRFSSEEKKALDRSQLDMYNEVRCGRSSSSGTTNFSLCQSNLRKLIFQHYFTLLDQTVYAAVH